MRLFEGGGKEVEGLAVVDWTPRTSSDTREFCTLSVFESIEIGFAFWKVVLCEAYVFRIYWSYGYYLLSFFISTDISGCGRYMYRNLRLL